MQTPEEESIEGDEGIIQPLESADKEKTRTNEKYNLRKSLAWDSAFFTSAGVFICANNKYDMLELYPSS